MRDEAEQAQKHARRNGDHNAPTISESGVITGKENRSGNQDETYEVAPAGNAVIMEEQLINSNRTVMDYNLMTNVMRKNVSLIQTAIGRQR